MDGTPRNNGVVDLKLLSHPLRGRFPGATARAPGTYWLKVTYDSFASYRQTVRVAEKALELSIALKIEAVVTSVTVFASLRNSDPNYGVLRSGEPRGVFGAHDLVLERDVATVTLGSGAFSFLPPGSATLPAVYPWATEISSCVPRRGRTHPASTST